MTDRVFSRSWPSIIGPLAMLKPVAGVPPLSCSSEVSVSFLRLSCFFPIALLAVSAGCAKNTPVLDPVVPVSTKPEPKKSVEPISTLRDESSGPKPEGMVWVPGGNFWMGYGEAPGGDAEPVRLVSLEGFWMDRTEVTNRQYAAFVKATGLTIPSRRAGCSRPWWSI